MKIAKLTRCQYDWAEMPDDYDASEVTDDDLRNDGQLRALGPREADTDASYTALDVGFDLRRHETQIQLGDARSVRYLFGEEERIVRGSLAEIVAALRAAGYQVSDKR